MDVSHQGLSSLNPTSPLALSTDCRFLLESHPRMKELYSYMGYPHDQPFLFHFPILTSAVHLESLHTNIMPAEAAVSGLFLRVVMAMSKGADQGFSKSARSSLSSGRVCARLVIGTDMATPGPILYCGGFLSVKTVLLLSHS